MLDRIKQILNNNNINGYKIYENKIEANELFFIKKNVDMDRAKNVHHFKVTVYVDYEDKGDKFKGSASIKIHPTMGDEEIKKAIDEAAFAAKFVKNPYYPLVKPSSHYKKEGVSDFSKKNLPYWMNEITKAIYKNDTEEKGGINSCEIFLNKIDSHIVTSEGIDVQAVSFEGMIEFITTWKEDSEEIELYRCINCSDFNPEELSQEVTDMITIAKEKAVAKNTPVMDQCTVLLTREAVIDFFHFYYTRSNAATVYSGSSTWKIGDQIQGESVKGDYITMTIDPFMKNSINSGSFDEDGFPLETVKIIEEGVLKRYIADTRYAYYLNVEPTGSIKNMIISGGSHTVNELKKGTYLETAAFSDFTVDMITGDFYGEIRLAWYFDGKNTIPVTGGSISGNIAELQQELYLSKELQKDNFFEGPKVVKLLNVTVAGIQ